MICEVNCESHVLLFTYRLIEDGCGPACCAVPAKFYGRSCHSSVTRSFAGKVVKMPWTDLNVSSLIPPLSNLDTIVCNVTDVRVKTL